MKRLLLLPIAFAVGCAPESKLNEINRQRHSKFEMKDVATLSDVPNWFTKSPEVDGVEGTRVELAYQKIEKPGKTIVVAVVDSGVDIEHEDLKANIWENAGEVGVDANGKDKSSNKVDDDNNGYVDDVHGWNFIGGYDENGKSVNLIGETLEVTREVIRYKKKKADLEAQGLQLSEADAAYLAKVEKEVTDGRTEAQKGKDEVEPALEKMKTHYEVLKDVLGVKIDDVKPATLKGLVDGALTPQQKESRDIMIQVFKDTGFSTVGRMKRFLEMYNDQLNYYYNEQLNVRKEIVKDRPDDFTDVKYGNNDVMGSDGEHGSHVSGIIAAVRGNEKGMDGIATNVKIMSVRAVPNGDERDKDVALSIRYAVDNGAHVINMSFGKGYSPNHKEVSKAFQYAEAHGVLLVHAAGNDNENNDFSPNFPNRVTLNDQGLQIGEISTWIEVGASTPRKAEDLPAYFSNFGLKSVDIFAPGFLINSTVPNNEYASFSGTSMASPTVAGVVALVMSQRSEEMTPWQIKKQVLNTHRSYPGLQVILPGTAGEHPTMVPFSLLSMTGGIVDALDALTVTN